MALAHSPELMASSHGVKAAEGSARQAGALPNPRLELQASEFGGSGARNGFDGAETSVQLSQLVEMGGKRGKRQRVAQAEARLTGWEYEATRLDVLAQTKKAFIDVLLAQGRLALTESLLAVAEDVRKAAAQRVSSGKVAPLEETKAGVEATTALIERDRAKRELDTARKRLAAAWGGTVPVFTEAAGDLSAVADIPSIEKLFATLDKTPELARGHEVLASGRESLAETIREGCDLRFRPLLMTTLTSFVGHFPMLYATGSGADIQKPLAVVVMGGLVTSTMLTLIVLPTIYGLIERRKERFKIG
jgi:cobalt-zinc-cadmium efflux system outer membrane protein